MSTPIDLIAQTIRDAHNDDPTAEQIAAAVVAWLVHEDIVAKAAQALRAAGWGDLGGAELERIARVVLGSVGGQS